MMMERGGGEGEGEGEEDSLDGRLKQQWRAALEIFPSVPMLSQTYW